MTDKLPIGGKSVGAPRRGMVTITIFGLGFLLAIIELLLWNLIIGFLLGY